MKTLNQTERIVREIETQLIEGAWAPGQRIPGERKLAEAMGAARSTVRTALQRLVARGLLASRPMSGFYVSDRLQTGLISPWRQLVSEHPELRPDMLEFRLMLEGTTAYLAAIRATDEDLARIEAVTDAMAVAHRAGDHAGGSRLDGDFHAALASASHNAMLRHLQASLAKMLHTHISLNNTRLVALLEQASGQLLGQHLALWEAIRARRPEDARRLMLEHIGFVWQRLEPDLPVTML
ncbi:FadR/GntR family transcriptional regulator [Burkholderia glumae]|uniref:FadR/GntR family transcriptional regulator n=1 Tax=Burkholderia glumae TaxID=337 RepID=UPI0003A823CA|nr:FadR/GntR family transcriptional regulator [Burkholderia glumae]MCM2493211.1 FadR family transcriptional regulator [Burkholderia glumae]MCM2544106.1 FadR family transcriptional regulator [Burkholderia glumae]